MKEARYLFISGWACTGQVWRPVIRELGIEGEAEAIPWWGLLEGLSGSGGFNPLKIAALQPSLASFPGKTFLLGWSLGGLLALDLAAAWPREIRASLGGLVLIGSTACLTARPAYPGVDRSWLEAMEQDLETTPGPIVRQFSELCFFPFSKHGQKSKFIQEALSLPGKELRSGLQYLKTVDLRATLHHCQLPVLILHGVRDRVIPLSQALYLRQELSMSCLVEFPQAGHALPYTHCPDITDHIREFFVRHV